MRSIMVWSLAWYREYRKYGDNAFLGYEHIYKEDARIA